MLDDADGSDGSVEARALLAARLRAARDVTAALALADRSRTVTSDTALRDAIAQADAAIERARDAFVLRRVADASSSVAPPQPLERAAGGLGGGDGGAAAASARAAAAVPRAAALAAYGELVEANHLKLSLRDHHREDIIE